MKKLVITVILLTLSGPSLLAQDSKRVIIDETSKWVMYGPYVKHKQEFYESVRLYFLKILLKESKNAELKCFIDVDSTGKMLPNITMGDFEGYNFDEFDTLRHFMRKYINNRHLHPSIEPAYLRFKTTNKIAFVKSEIILYLKFRRGEIRKVSHKVSALKPKRRSIHSGE